MIFDLTGAAFSRAATYDGLPMVIVPLLIAGVVMTSWALRPESRMLKMAK
jgi:lipoprotein signal peptidase